MSCLPQDARRDPELIRSVVQTVLDAIVSRSSHHGAWQAKVACAEAASLAAVLLELVDSQEAAACIVGAVKAYPSLGTGI